MLLGVVILVYHRFTLLDSTALCSIKLPSIFLCFCYLMFLILYFSRLEEKQNVKISENMKGNYKKVYESGLKLVILFVFHIYLFNHKFIKNLENYTTISFSVKKLENIDKQREQIFSGKNTPMVCKKFIFWNEALECML